MPRPPDPLVARYKLLIARHGDRTAAGCVAAWDRLDRYDDDAIVRYEAQTKPLIHGAKVAAVAASVALFARAHRIAPPSVTAADVDVEARVRDPFFAMRHAVAEGRPISEAIAAGRSVADAVAHNFVTSASRRAADHAAAVADISTRWERVPGNDACDFCTTVAGQTYTSAESADFGHDRCNCVVVPA